MNEHVKSPAPDTVGKLWAFFVLGILITTIAFVVASWQGLEIATTRRLGIMASAVAQVEESYLNTIAKNLARLGNRLEHTPRARRLQVLRHYLARHTKTTGVALVRRNGQILLSAGPFLHDNMALRKATLSAYTSPSRPGGLYFSAPITWQGQNYVLFVHRVSGTTDLLSERPILSWPHLHSLITKLPSHFHIFIVTRQGQLEYKLPETQKLMRVFVRHGALMRALRQKAISRHGAFSGQTHDGWRLGAYESGHYGLVAAVSLPLKTLIETFVRGLEIPVLLIFGLIASATLYYRYSRQEMAQIEVLQQNSDKRIREERAFAEQQRDFYLAVSELNQLIVRHPDPEHLFPETCRIIVAYTGLLFAWIGRVESSGNIRVVAFSEKRPLGIDWFHCLFTADPRRPEGQGTAGRAVRSGHIEITDDLAHDNRFSPWRTMHDAAGTQSAAALPIRTKSGVNAVLALGSEQLNLFSPPLVRLLEGLAQDLAFSLEDTEREQQLAHQARHDALTGLDNRTLFREKLAAAITDAAQSSQALSVAILDLDGFKAINDQFGHVIGDESLQRIAQRLAATVPPGTTTARLGGDEFAIILSPITSREHVTEILESVRIAMDSPFTLGSHQQLDVAASMGVSLFPDDGDKVDDLIRRADLALYEAKRLGKNILRFFTPALEERLLNRRHLQQEFSKALRENIPVLYFQPQVEISTGRIRSFEALLRWPHADGKIWAPGDYFPAIIQDSDLMRRLDIFVLKQAFAAIERLASEGLRFPVAVNIHGPHLLHPDFLGDLSAVVRQHEDFARLLEIEITETSQLADLTQASTVLDECRSLGVAIALDDFGTGYASLNYLQKLPCDILKIDRSFVSDMADDPRDFAIVSGILTAANVLHIATVAEGVEQVEQGLLLRDLGCQYAQGYVISKPIPLDMVATWTHGWRAPPVWVASPQERSGGISLWLARATHRAHFHAANHSLRKAREGLSAAVFATYQCPLHSWLQASGNSSLCALHADIHQLIQTGIHEQMDVSDTLVSTLTQLHSAEEQLDTYLMERLTGNTAS